MPIQDITLFGLLFPAIRLKMVAVNFCYTALAGLIRQIHQMARHTGEQTRPPTILYREVRMLETRITFVKFSLFFAGLSFLFNLLAVGSHISSVFSMQLCCSLVHQPACQWPFFYFFMKLAGRLRRCHCTLLISVSPDDKIKTCTFSRYSVVMLAHKPQI